MSSFSQASTLRLGADLWGRDTLAGEQVFGSQHAYESLEQVATHTRGDVQVAWQGNRV